VIGERLTVVLRRIRISCRLEHMVAVTDESVSAH
jgi:hypothetical protein